MITTSAPHSANGSFSVFPAAFNTAKCEKLQKEKEALELRFEEELRKLGWQQQAEVQELQERLQRQFQAESARLQAEHQDQLLRMRCQHQEQVSRAWVTRGIRLGVKLTHQPHPGSLCTLCLKCFPCRPYGSLSSFRMGSRLSSQ